nr:hypothetical protein [Tanacetum cinerariifolium]
MATTIEQQVALDEALVPSAKRLRIGRSNFRLPSYIQSKESTLQVVYDVLRRSPFFKAFLVTADVPEIYMQEFWATTKVHQHSIRFKMDTRKNIVDLEAFREMLHISPRVLGQSFAELPFEEVILEFLRFLGHSAQIKTLTDVNVNKLFQPWRSFAAVINNCLTGKSSGFDSLRRNVDYAFLIWEDFVYQMEHKNQKKSNEMYYPRFTKVIIYHFMTKKPLIPRRNKVNWHYVRDDILFSTIKVAYKEYYACATGKAAPKPKASARRKRGGSASSTTPPTPIATPTPITTVVAAPRLTTGAKGKQPARATSPTDPSDVERTKAKQLKIVLRRSRRETHISQQGGSSTDEGTSSKPGNTQQYGAVLPIELTNEEIRNTKAYKEHYACATGEAASKPKASAKRKRSDVDAQEKNRDDDEGDEKGESADKEEDDDDERDDDEEEEEEEIAKTNEQEDAERGGDDDEKTKSDEESDGDETREEESFDPIPKTPEDIEDDGNVKIQIDRLRDSYQRENDEFLRTSDDNMKRRIKEQVKSQVKEQVSKILPRIKQSVNAQIKAEVLTRRDDDDDQGEGPSVGSDRGSKRQREGKEPESASTPLEPATRSAGRSTTGSKYRQASTSESAFVKEPVQTTSQIKEPSHLVFETGSKSRQASASESAFAEEPVQTTSQIEEPSHPVFKTGAEDQPIVQSSQHPEWFSQPKKRPTPDRDWNKTLPVAQGSTQSWISDLAKKADSRSSFNELLDTPLDFSNFIMNRIRVDTLTPELLAGPTYELMKGSCNSLTEKNT